MIRNASTYVDNFFRSSLAKLRINVGLTTGTFVQKYFDWSSSIQLKMTSLGFLMEAVPFAGSEQRHQKTIALDFNHKTLLAFIIFYISIWPFFFIFLFIVAQMPLASTVSNSNLRPLSFFSFSSLK